MPPIVSTQSLTKLYGVVIGVNDVTLEIDGGVIGLLGPNGAGKSTFLKLMTGQLKPTEGEIRVFGKTPWNNPGIFKKIGFCPEQDAFYDHLSALEFVTSLGKLSGLGRRARGCAENALGLVGAGDFMNRPIGEYSKGMRQRTKVAQALVHEPDLLILDEPLAGTDPIGRREIMDLVVRLGNEGRDILISSHVLHEVQDMTDRFALIYGGRILASGEVHEIRSLMNEFPHRITIKSSDNRKLAAALLEGLPIQGVELAPIGNRLSVLTHDPGLFYSGFPALVNAAGIEVKELSSADDNLESVFHYLISRD